MLVACALLNLVLWFNAFTTELGKYIVILSIEILGTILLGILMMGSTCLSLVIVWRSINGN